MTIIFINNFEFDSGMKFLLEFVFLGEIYWLVSNVNCNFKNNTETIDVFCVFLMKFSLFKFFSENF